MVKRRYPTPDQCIAIKRIPEGGFFTKRTGTFVYIRISDDSARFHKLAPGIYGVCYNGNIIRVEPDTLVVKRKAEDFLNNIKDDVVWHHGIGAVSDHEEDL